MSKRVLCPCIAAMTAVILLTGCASRAFYYPDRKVYRTPDIDGLAYKEATFKSPDGTPLHGWFIPAATKARGTVIHFHGNAQNMTAHYSFVSWLPREGFNVFTFDYRGYGKSGGTAERKGIRADSKAALDYVRTRKDVAPNRLLVLGQSLGGATALAAIEDSGTKGIKAVVVDSTFYSYRSIVRTKLKSIPVVGWLRWPLSYLIISNAGSPASCVKDLPPVPLMIIHGKRDRIIPYRQGVMLFEKAGEPKEMISVPDGRHTDALMRKDPQYRQKVVNFFNNALDHTE